MDTPLPAFESAAVAANDALSLDEIMLASQKVSADVRQSELSIAGISCGSCIARIEQALGEKEGVLKARVNLSNKRVLISWNTAVGPELFIAKLRQLGYSPTLPVSTPDIEYTKTLSDYLRALAVAGFAAGNVMLLSVSVWSGADAETRSLFHVLSALISIPCLLYAGRVFYLSAWQALRHGRTNMDIPISIGILVSCVTGLYDTATGGEHVYFEAAVTLVFFLLIGRTLDHLMRKKASQTLNGLASIEPQGAHRIMEDGSRTFVAAKSLKPGDLIEVAPGQRLPVDGAVESGRSELDCSLVTGESLPVLVVATTDVQAGSMNLNAMLKIRVTATVENSFLGRIRQMVANAELSRGKYQRIADRAARWYVPVVHSAAVLSLVVWFLATGDLHRSITIAVAVLIITCPCAFGLAVPMVHVMAARRLLSKGILMKNGAALERLPEVDTIIFDKTGTLTDGKPSLESYACVGPKALQTAQSLAQFSTHPYAKAITNSVFPELKNSKSIESSRADQYPLNTRGAKAHNAPTQPSILESPGLGLESNIGSDMYRLGRIGWAVDQPDKSPDLLAKQLQAGQSSSYLSCNGKQIASFSFSNKLRTDALAAIESLRDHVPLQMEVLSGDNREAVHKVASELNILVSGYSRTPLEKTRYVQTLTQHGHTVLMVGDGINDCGALTAASVSMAPGNAAEIGRSSADFVFLPESLLAIPYTVDLAKKAQRLVKQNMAIAIGYNLIALPFAMLGYVTPLTAALAMSSSSILVVANALRLRESASQKKVSIAKSNGDIASPSVYI